MKDSRGILIGILVFLCVCVGVVIFLIIGIKTNHKSITSLGERNMHVYPTDTIPIQTARGIYGSPLSASSEAKLLPLLKFIAVPSTSIDISGCISRPYVTEVTPRATITMQNLDNISHRVTIDGSSHTVPANSTKKITIAESDTNSTKYSCDGKERSGWLYVTQ